MSIYQNRLIVRLYPIMVLSLLMAMISSCASTKGYYGRSEANVAVVSSQKHKVTIGKKNSWEIAYGKNIPVSIIVDELPTLYFHKIDRLIGTARSNKVSVALGFQELPQLEADYGKVGMQKIITTVGNVVSGSARSKETLEWLSSDIFGKVVQLKKGVTIDRDKTSINLNENMDSLVPASKISDMPTGWICGQTARDFVQTKTGSGGSMNIQESEEFKTSKFYCKTDFDMKEIKKEEAGYVPLPKFYTFKSRDERERILYKNFVQVGEDVKEMIQEILKYKVK